LWTSAPAVTNRQKSPTFRHELKKFLHSTDVTDPQYADISFYDRILHAATGIFWALVHVARIVRGRTQRRAINNTDRQNKVVEPEDSGTRSYQTKTH